MTIETSAHQTHSQPNTHKSYSQSQSAVSNPPSNSSVSPAFHTDPSSLRSSLDITSPVEDLLMHLCSITAQDHLQQRQTSSLVSKVLDRYQEAYQMLDEVPWLQEGKGERERKGQLLDKTIQSKREVLERLKDVVPKGQSQEE